MPRTGGLALAIVAMVAFSREAGAAAISAPAAEADARAYARLGDLLLRRGSGEFSARAEAGGGFVLSPYQQERLGFDQLLQGTARLGLSLSESFSVQLSAGSVVFFADGSSSGQLFTVLQGVRVDRPVARLGCAFADFNFGVGESARRTRVALDAGLGFELPILPYVDIGLFARYHHVFSATPDAGGDARFLSFGIAGSLRRIGLPRPQRQGPTDVDRDGVLDRDDLCPHTPSEPDPDPRRPGCPARDSDRDGFVDPVDHCPTLPPTPHPDPARPGCPAADRDRDRISDPLDACPGEPGVPSADAKRNGCPALVEVERDRLRTLKPVFFATGEDRILPESEPLLRDIAEVLRKNSEIRLSIEGHTDDTGTDAHNLDLSRRRAESVRQALVRLGIDGARLEARGFGRSKPLLPGTSAEAREKNRRVELLVLPARGRGPGP